MPHSEKELPKRRLMQTIEINPIAVCMIAWTVLWLGIWQAKRLHVTVGNEAQKKTTAPANRFWLTRISGLLLSLAIGLGTYTQYLVEKYDLPRVYQWQAMAWVLSINRPLPTLVSIPAGSFEMGSEDGGSDEKPVHRVTISERFSMGEHEVTFTQYDYFIWQMRQNGFSSAEYPKDENWGRSEFPAINVDLSESQAYLNWLNHSFGQTLSCRLPSEAEWEYAARAGSKTKYYWGDEPDHNYANYGDEECCKGLAKGNDQWINTAPIKQFKPNKFGLYDMSGNVSEWVQDQHHESYRGAPQDGSAWEGESVLGRVPPGQYTVIYQTAPEDSSASKSGKTADSINQPLLATDIFRVARPLKETFCEDIVYNENGWPKEIPATCINVIRGGSWSSTSLGIRTAKRFNIGGVDNSNVGFRIVCSPIEI